jgi:hypothetical protein
MAYNFVKRKMRPTVSHGVRRSSVLTGIRDNDSIWVQTLCGKTFDGRRDNFSIGYSAYVKCIDCRVCRAVYITLT